MFLNDNEENVRLIREYERNWKESMRGIAKWEKIKKRSVWKNLLLRAIIFVRKGSVEISK